MNLEREATALFSKLERAQILAVEAAELEFSERCLSGSKVNTEELIRKLSKAQLMAAQIAEVEYLSLLLGYQEKREKKPRIDISKLPPDLHETLFGSEIFEIDYFRVKSERTREHVGRIQGSERGPAPEIGYKATSNALEMAIYKQFTDIPEPISVYAHDLLRIQAVKRLVAYVGEASKVKSVGEYLKAIRRKKYSRIEKDTEKGKRYVIKPIDYKLVADAADEIINDQKIRKTKWVTSLQIAQLIRDPTNNLKIEKNLAEWARRNGYKSAQVSFESYGRIKVYYKGPEPPRLKR
ncbi:hypothetical protein HYY71_05725 [Candidatus Woesearchaeota archaeon]|nr:hypothetical protein [Candidatus Woesearchaeota archaeon]